MGRGISMNVTIPIESLCGGHAMSGDDGSVTRWIGELKAGEAEAAEALWDRYFRRLVGLAKARLSAGRAAAVEDEEDAALSAFKSLWIGATAGRFDRLRDRDDLWKLLVVLTARKASDQRRRQGRQKRGGGLVSPGPGNDDLLAVIADEEPTPAFAALIAEEFSRRLDALQDGTLVRIATLRMEGYGNDEIAARLGCTTRTVERKLQVIRKTWEQEPSS